MSSEQALLRASVDCHNLKSIMNCRYILAIGILVRYQWYNTCVSMHLILLHDHGNEGGMEVYIFSCSEVGLRVFRFEGLMMSPWLRRHRQCQTS